MAKRYWRKCALLAKTEVTYGVDPTPAGATDAMLAIDVTFTPLEGEELSRELMRPYLGHQGVILAGLYGRLEFSVELAGSGAAGTAPKYAPLLKACGLAETITAVTKADYDLVSVPPDAVTIWYNPDGVKHVFNGSRGTFSLELAPRTIPRWRFVFTGLLGALADTALPSTTLTGFVKPVAVSKANTVFTLHGVTGPTERVSIDLGNQVEARLLIGDESIEIVNRQAMGSAVMEAALLATKNWDAIARAHTTGALTLTHGTVAGNIVEITAPAVQIGRWSQGQTQGIINNTLPLMLLPVAGNDELKISVK